MLNYDQHRNNFDVHEPFRAEENMTLGSNK